MVRLRLPVLLVAVALAALVALRALRSGEPGADDSLVRGTWRAESGGLSLDLDETGRYRMAATGTAGVVIVECGRWQAEQGLVRMRAEWQTEKPGTLDAVLLRERALRLARYEAPTPQALILLTAVIVESGSSKPPGIRFSRAGSAQAPGNDPCRGAERDRL